MDAILLAAQMVFQPDVLVTIVLAALFGLFVGAVPGLTATMAIALLVPVTFFMSPVPAIGAMVTCSAMAIFAGDIPGTLLRIPGTPASAAYTDEAYAMTRKGQGELALGANLLFSALGGLFGTAVLIVAAPSLAEVALQFSSFEYFWLALPRADLRHGGRHRLDHQGAGQPDDRPAGRHHRAEQPGRRAALHLRQCRSDGRHRLHRGDDRPVRGVGDLPRTCWGCLRTPATSRRRPATCSPAGASCQQYWRQSLRGNVLGTAIGALPGAGADIAAWVSYAVSKRFSQTPEKFGTGHVEGIIESTSSQQRRAWRRLGPGAGVRHSGRQHHGDRHRRAVPEGDESGADDLHQQPAEHLRGLPDLHPGEHLHGARSAGRRSNRPGC